MENLERLSKIMAFRGLCSRREADIFIEKGFVTVNGNIVSVLGSKVPIDSEIKLSNEAIILQNSSITILLNKPIGFMLLFWPCSWGLAFAYSENQNLNLFFFVCNSLAFRSVQLKLQSLCCI